jgi:hypothetical protein
MIVKIISRTFGLTFCLEKSKMQMKLAGKIDTKVNLRKNKRAEQVATVKMYCKTFFFDHLSEANTVIVEEKANNDGRKANDSVPLVFQ